MKGITDKITKDGIRVVKVHYSADPTKDPFTPEGREWMQGELLGYPGGKLGAKWRREMEIDFHAQGGQLVFPDMELYRDRIFIKPIDFLPKSWKYYGGFDYAGRGVTAFVIIAHDPKLDEYYCVYEFYKKNSGYAQTSKEILGNRLYDRLEWVVADPSMWSKTQERGNGGDLVSMAQLFSEQGVHFIKGVRGGDVEFSELISQKMWKGLPKKQPRYRIFKNCENHYREMSKWRYSEWAAATALHRNVKETMVDKDNHSIDAAKYLFKMLSSNWMADKVESFDMSKHVIYEEAQYE